MGSSTQVGLRIKRAREARGWTQAQLAAQIGVDRKTVDNWENNRTVPLNRLGRLSAVLGIDFDGEDVPRDLFAAHDLLATVTEAERPQVEAFIRAIREAPPPRRSTPTHVADAG